MASRESHRAFALNNVRIFNGQSIAEPTTIFIEDGLIVTQVAGDAATIDGEGGVLLPGFIDAHMHLNGEAELHAMAKHGITTALDMATFPASKLDTLRSFKAKSEAAGVAVPDFRSPGTPATSPGSTHSILLSLPLEDFVSTPDDAGRFVQGRLKQGADYIKIVADVPGPDQATINAIVEEAHKHDKLVIAHASESVPYEMALKSKADIITHVPVDKPLSPELCGRMAGEGRIAVPTLVMMEAVTGALSFWSLLRMLLQPITLFKIIKIQRQKPARTGKPNYQNAKQSVTNLHRAGVPILCGTDAHEEASSPFSVKHGPSLHRELELLVDAGLMNLEALHAMTSLPAKYFRLGDRGSIEVGKRADLVLLKEGQDPLLDIRATRAIKRVWCAGIEVDLL
ncbi:hypothetical protein H2200_005416 [Cladophialophora chaetospira]|uniref:Amidohydrolase-related domain-containing protein n=1 Tax=Cladophialophora chaetospira TaxID=386627 RepID=A0AA38XCL7_9EURO|nr:hypothetical protein H2200_005416 [Cladophialophora chaetospira]